MQGVSRGCWASTGAASLRGKELHGGALMVSCGLYKQVPLGNPVKDRALWGKKKKRIFHISQQF